MQQKRKQRVSPPTLCFVKSASHPKSKPSESKMFKQFFCFHFGCIKSRIKLFTWLKINLQSFCVKKKLIFSIIIHFGAAPKKREIMQVPKYLPLIQSQIVLQLTTYSLSLRLMNLKGSLQKLKVLNNMFLCFRCLYKV